MELLILGAIILIGIIFVYEFLQSNPVQSSGSKKILTADEASSTEDDKLRARSILKKLKENATDEVENKASEKSDAKEQILPDPFSDQETKK